MNRRKGVGDSSDEEGDAASSIRTRDVADPSSSNISIADDDRGSRRASASTEPNVRGSTKRATNDDEVGDESGDESGASGDDADDADSSEEDSDDEDEIAKVREGFIVDSDSESEDTQKRKRRRKRRRRDEEDVQLDEDDLDVIGAGGRSSESRFKRLKRASSDRRRGLDAMFDDDDDDDDEDTAKQRGGEFDDFIEADEFSEDEAEALRRAEQREIGQRRAGAMDGLAVFGDLAGLDEEKLSEIYDVFGDGEMYDWALAGEEDVDAAHPPVEEEVQLTDVFEPFELEARMLTADDNRIRVEDLPERFQLLRQRLTHAYELDTETYAAKQAWIADRVVEKKEVELSVAEHVRGAVVSVVDFIAKENLEVPFIWHHRQDFLVHFSSTESTAVRTQLLDLDDLWAILDLDMDFHALLDRKTAAAALSAQISSSTARDAGLCADEYHNMSQHATSATEFQDLIEYMQFRYSGALRAQRRHLRFGLYDRIRSSTSMEIVDAIGCDADDVARVLVPEYPVPEEFDSFEPITQPIPGQSPQELAESSGGSVDDAVNYASTALTFHPQVRQFFRACFERKAKVDLVVTDDGRKKITPSSPFADLKYSCNWTLSELREQPALFLRMLRAEEQGLLIVRAQYPHYKTSLYEAFARVLGAGEGDGAWAEVRARVAKAVSRAVVPLIARNVLEVLRADCIRSLRFKVRRSFAEKLNQAPYKPPGYVLGTVPRAMCISAGEGHHTDAVLAAVVDEDGHVSECVKLGDVRAAGFGERLVQATRAARPDIVGVAGFTPSTRRLFEDVRKYIVDESQLTAGPEDAEQSVQVVWVNDEVARLFRNSQRAVEEFPDLVPNARYCVAGARYLQGPLYEYAQLDAAQLRSLSIHPEQDFLSDEDFAWATETAYVDYVCLDGVDINVAVRQQYRAAVLPYVAGLGPRKAQGIVQAIQARARSGRLANRSELITGEMTTSTVFMNCASFFKIPWTNTPEDDSDFLDSTRIHPEDYELARKMCADALELDEEDVLVVEEEQPGGVVVKLLNEDSEGRKLDELILEEYAKELLRTFKQQKRVTLEQIRQEIQDPFAEKRESLHTLTPEEVFTMLSGETVDTFANGSVMSGTVRRVTGRQLVLSLSGGIDAIAESGSISDDRSIPLNQQFSPGQAVQAVVLNADYARLFAVTSTRASAVQEALKKLAYKDASSKDTRHWNFEAERRDTQLAQRRAEQRQRQLRVIKHPLFRPFSAKEAEAYLAPLQRGDLVIRPSSRGPDHLVVTWKVSEQIYQHIDVQELDKPNEYALGRTLQVGPYKYTDLDELILMHVQALVRKVDEISASEKFQRGNRKDVERWLQAYTHARPTQSVYAFCFDHRRPGYVLLCYMLGAGQPIRDLHVKVLPNGYELLGNQYPDVLSLANGFKTMVQRARV